MPVSCPYRGVSVKYSAISLVIPIKEQSPGFVIIMTAFACSHLTRVLPTCLLTRALVRACQCLPNFFATSLTASAVSVK